MESEQGDRI